MKTTRHFFFTFVKRTISKTYGGENFTLAVFENKGRGKIVRIGETSGCTRGHKGFPSDAWEVVWEKAFTPRQKKAMLAKAGSDAASYHFPGYYSWSLAEKLGIKLEGF